MTAKVKKVDDKVWIQALVDGKRVNIKESSIRCTLRLDDAEVLDLESEVIDIKSTYQARIKKLKSRVKRLEGENRVLKELKSVHSKVDSDEPVMEMEKSSKQERKIADIDTDVEINLEKAQAEAYILDLDHQEKDYVIAASVKVPKLRKKKGVIIQDLEETITTVIVQPKVQAKDKGKAILIEEPKREKLTDAVMKYQALKRKPLKEAQARRNMIVYLKNMAGYKMDYFKGMSYDEIRPLFEKHYNYNQGFLNEVNKGVKVPEKEIPIIDYKIHTERNRPYFKIIRADGNHMLFLSFSTMLKNFDREDIKSLWNIVRERFAKTEPKNYSDDFLLNTLIIMFEKPNVEANVWKDKKGKYGLVKVKRWKLIESCGVRCLTLLTTQTFLLVERIYPLTQFTLEQMLNDVRLKVEDKSKMSLELLRLVRR
nr:hypothetical protein [Tanacetum cinerariifolium]